MNSRLMFKVDSPRKANISMIFFLLYSTTFVNMIFGGFMYFLFQDSDKFLVLTLVGGQLLSFILPLCIYLIVTRQKPTELFSFKKIGIKNIAFVVGMTILLIPFTMFLSALANLFVNNDVSEVMAELMNLKGGLPVNLLILAVAPAICEELFFRGLILRGYKNISLVTAALVNGLYFGLMHLNLQQFLYAFVLGMIFSVFVHYTGSIFASMIAHFTLNGSNVLLMQFANSASEITNDQIGLIDMESFGVKMVTVVSIFFVSIFFLIAFWFVFKKFVEFNGGMVKGIFKEKLFAKVGENNNIENIDVDGKNKVFDVFFGMSIGYYVLFMAFVGVMNYFAAKIM